MPTEIKIPEKSFRIGCGRYIQESGAIELLGEEIVRLNTSKPFIIGSKTALSITKDMILKSLSDKQISPEFYLYEGFCNKEHCNNIAESFKGKFDVVIGVGGGNIMDAAKLVAVYANTPVINIPTSSATCAATAPLSVCYNDNFQTVGTVHHMQEVNCVLVDMDILKRQPMRLFLAGVYDALAKQYELNQRMLGIEASQMDIGLLSSYKLSNFTFDFLTENLPAGCESIENQENTKILDDIVFVCVALTGVVSGLARGSNQTAIAHKVYEVSRKLFPKEVYSKLHGEMVAVGLIAQLVFNNDSKKDDFITTLKALKMPASLPDLGVKTDDKVIEMYYDAICNSSAMAGADEKDKKKLRMALNSIRGEI